MKKKVLLIGASGLLGANIAKALEGKVQIIASSLHNFNYSVDISDEHSLKNLFEKVGEVDGIICTAGLANFADWRKATSDDWSFAIKNKMMGQINILRFGASVVKDGGAIVLTTGLLAQHPIAGSGIVSTVNAAVEAAVRSAALELSGRIRINAVSPGWIKETLKAMGMNTDSGLSAAEVANFFVEQFETGANGSIAVAAN